MRFLLVLLTMGSLSACGYKSPLLLPQTTAEKGRKPAATIVTPDPAPDRPVPSEAVPVVR